MKSSWIFAGVVSLAGALVAACGPSSGALPDASITPVCVPGQSQTCFGTGGCAGAQLCANDGQSFEACICGAPRSDASVDASRPDAAEAGPPDAAPDGSPLSPPPGCVTATIGPAGGILTHPAGATVVVPWGALALATPLSLCPGSASVAGAVGPVFQAGPEGQTFLRPVQVTIAYDAARVSAGADVSTVQLRMAPAGSTDFAALQSRVDLGAATASTTHFTQFAPAQSAAPVFITTNASIPSATTGVAYGQQLAAQGGTPPYTWSLPAGSALPPGLVLHSGGLLGGTPSVPDNFAFFVAVTDSAGTSVELAVTLAVLAAANPVPSLVVLSPSAVAQGSADTVVTLSGAAIAPNAIVLWDGVPLPSTFLGATQIAATLPAVDLATDGTHQVTITNPAPGGGTSASAPFTVTPGPIDPPPSLTSIAPSPLPTASIDTQITVTGTNFVASSTVLLGSQPIATTKVSSSQLSAIVPAAFLAAPGVLPFAVSNPPPGGGVSSPISVDVGTPAPRPSIATLSPSSTVAGSGTLSLGIQGDSFVAGAQAFFGSVALSTTVLSSSNITATVPQGLLASAGNVAVVVVNPGGLVSVAAAFVIEGPGDDAGTDAGPGTNGDAGADATIDAGTDAASDADTTIDASNDGTWGDDAADATVSDDATWGDDAADATVSDDATWGGDSTDDGTGDDGADGATGLPADIPAGQACDSPALPSSHTCSAGLTCGLNPTCDDGGPCDPMFICQ